MPKKAKPLWSGRTAPLHRDADIFLETEDEWLIDEEDVQASRAHTLALEEAGLITKTEGRKLRQAMKGDLLGWRDDDEDVHSRTERVLTERLGDLGAKLHTGRSRNDLVATDVRLFVRRHVLRLAQSVSGLMSALADRADQTTTMVCPGYTHLQRGQPITVAHWLLAHAFAFERDVNRIMAAYDAADVSPLGAGALAGNTLGIKPSVSAEALGFGSAFDNSIDAVSDRDFLLDAMYAYTTASLHLSRLGEELVIWTSEEFGFVRAPDGFATGSSMMPQKRNPDVAEVARAETGKATGALIDLTLTLKGLPLAYARDLQQTKRCLWTLFGADESFNAMRGFVRGMTLFPERLLEAASTDALFATDIAEELVRNGVPFRRAHEVVASLVREAEAARLPLRDVLQVSADALAPLQPDEAIALLDPVASVRRRTTPGGPSAKSVRAQIRKIRRSIDRATKAIAEAEAALPRA